MTVTGTQQRVYGQLVSGGCLIDLHRFALVSGSTTAPPVTSGLTFSDEYPTPGDTIIFALGTDQTISSTPTITLTGPSTITATGVTYGSFTVTYANTTPYKQCGHAYAGFITLLLLSSGTTVYAAVELRICKNDSKRIVLETYGQVKHTVTGGISLWFNKGSDAEPDWQLLNSAAYNTIMPYATTSGVS